ncbi:MAG: tetratricopeptide repeat protein [Terriglobales bacterium]
MSGAIHRQLEAEGPIEVGILRRWRELLDHPGLPEFFLAVLTGLVYARSLRMGFVYDDHQMIDSPWLLGWKDIPKIFTEDLGNTHLSNFYRPLAVLWQLLVHKLAGTNAAGWHFSTIFLHLLCVVLVFRLAVKLLKHRGYATFAAAVFALHPSHVEVVTWVSDSADLLLTLFLLLSAWALLRWLHTTSPLWWTASWLLAAACCFVKETGILLPTLLLALALTVESKVSRPAIVLTVFAYLLSACAFLVLRSQILHGFSHPLSNATNYQMVLTWPRAMYFYLSHLVLPVRLGPFYPLGFVLSPRKSAFIFPLLLLVALLAGLLWLDRRLPDRRLLWFCVVWTLVPLIAPLYLKLFPDFELVHDRYLYIPSIAFAIALAAVLRKLFLDTSANATHKRNAETCLALAALVVLVALGAETISYQGAWQDDEHLFSRAIVLTPRNARALVNLAVAKLQQGNYAEGSALLKRSLQIQPNNAFALFDLGNAAWVNNDAVATEAYVARALALESHPNWWVILGSAKLKLGKVSEAEWAARQAIALDPATPGAHFLLGAARLAQGDPSTAVQEINNELRLYPGNPSAQQALQVAQDQLRRQGN